MAKLPTSGHTELSCLGQQKLHNAFSFFAYIPPPLNPQRISGNLQKHTHHKRRKMDEGIRAKVSEDRKLENTRDKIRI